MTQTERDLRALLAHWPASLLSAYPQLDGSLFVEASGTAPPLRGSTPIAAGRGETEEEAMRACLKDLREYALKEAARARSRAEDRRTKALQDEAWAAAVEATLASSPRTDS